MRAARLQAGLSQQALAERVGLSRQAMNAIETGRAVPNTAVALRLAQVLRCRVEDLFAEPELSEVGRLRLSAVAPGRGSRLAVARVREQWVGYSLAAGRDVLDGFAPADGLLAPGGHSARIRLLAPRAQLERTAVLVGCDPSLSIVCAHAARNHADRRLLWFPAPSEAALAAVAAGEAHVAGSHLWDPAAGAFNLPHAERALAATGGIVVRYARWELGLVVAPGNPKGLRAVADLVGTGVRIVNREAGSGSRALLDDRLAALGAPATAVLGYERVVSSHLDVARAVAAGSADAGIALRATADAFGLEFVPLAEAQFDLTIPRDHLDHPAIALLLDLLQSGPLREELRALPGYEVDQLGTLLAEVAGPANGRP
ncbi:MAG: substrate-binding domain-containing protein [Chloroflexota bacterium]|nr:helix-turn-helix domain-containing protein [Dehalococcoidia bacterium]MDW8252248.1 substrate-binding domain-containing protein [Chloroflexota bacterium]